jgi:hypothetical protein
MTRNSKTRVAVVVLAAVAIGIPVAARAEAADGGAAQDCISFWGEARFGGVGFNHVVHIANKCEESAVCDVSTDVSPAPQTVQVPGGRTVEVVTYLDSPVSKFTPRVTCTM